ncbi:MAG: hypothetical protein GY711_31795 [bacterium]|nr:hypothetical protein [bacterium]
MMNRLAQLRAACFLAVLVMADGSGRFQLGPQEVVALSALHFFPTGGIQPGETWNFQVWYRDSGGPCGSSFNFTNAVRVAFE